MSLLNCVVGYFAVCNLGIFPSQTHLLIEWIFPENNSNVYHLLCVFALKSTPSIISARSKCNMSRLYITDKIGDENSEHRSEFLKKGYFVN